MGRREPGLSLGRGVGWGKVGSGTVRSEGRGTNNSPKGSRVGRGDVNSHYMEPKRERVFGLVWIVCNKKVREVVSDSVFTVTSEALKREGAPFS